jgi:hypothetical protein
MNTHLWISRIITGILSIITASNLRNRVYTLEQRVDSLELAIEDIERINANSATPNALISGIIQNLKKP